MLIEEKVKRENELKEKKKKMEGDPNEQINMSSLTSTVMAEIKKKEETLSKAKKEELVKRKSETPSISAFKKQENSGDGMRLAEFIQERTLRKDLYHEQETTGALSGSITSTAVQAIVKQERRLMKEEEIRKFAYDWVKSHHKTGLVQLVLNIGELNVEIFSDKVPRTAENFLELCSRKYYNHVEFHRLIHGFMIQGGDPTGKGTGGQSIFGKGFKDEFHQKLHHDREGLLSMANAGPDTNGSQFFITLDECPHLDYKHSIFGQVVGGKHILNKINSTPVDRERPMVSTGLDMSQKEVKGF